MTHHGNNIPKRVIAAVLLLVITGCATTSHQPWIENGNTLGTLYIDRAAYGATYRYVNAAGQLQRQETRDLSGRLLPGAVVKKFKYDATGNLAEEANVDGAGNPVVGNEGYATKKCAYFVRDGGNYVVRQDFLDKNGRPVRTASGYASLVLIHDGATPAIKEVFMMDECNAPIAIRLDGVNGVSHVKFMVLDGIGQIRCGVYYAPSGAILAKRVLNGTSDYFSQMTTTVYCPKPSPDSEKHHP